MVNTFSKSVAIVPLHLIKTSRHTVYNGQESPLDNAMNRHAAPCSPVADLDWRIKSLVG